MLAEERKEVSLTGLDAISAANGWAIAVVGVTIVFTGLVLLSLAISQLHKILQMWEDRRRLMEQVSNKWKPRLQTEQKIESAPNAHDIKETAKQAKILVQFIGEPFPLPKLLELSGSCGIFKPYSTINALVLNKYLIPDGRGYYRWNSDKKI